RLETLVLLAGTELPSRAIRGQIASAINVVVQTERLRGGARKIVSVAEMLGVVDGEIAMQEIFNFRQVGVTPDGRAVGYHTATGLLAAGAETSEERELAAIVETGAEQVARIIDEWLDSATIESGEFELALHPLDIRSAVESCLALVSGGAGSKGLDISFNAAADVPSVVIGDSRRIEQILLTLLHGAVERTYRGGISVELSSEDRGGLVALHFKIRDTGRGVPARILRGAIEGVTGPYDRLEPGDRLAVLSLRTTKQLVGLVDGDLRVEQGGVEAGPDAGTTFNFTILAE